MKNKGANTLEAITLTDNQQPNKYYYFDSDSKNEIENSMQKLYRICKFCKQAYERA